MSAEKPPSEPTRMQCDRCRCTFNAYCPWCKEPPSGATVVEPTESRLRGALEEYEIAATDPLGLAPVLARELIAEVRRLRARNRKLVEACRNGADALAKLACDDLASELRAAIEENDDGE
jgi:hypothetical protein